jgi:WD40 repeat protein
LPDSTDARIHRVAFSPDAAFVAVATVHQIGKYWMDYRLGIWNMKIGELVHELRPFEHNERGEIDGLLWSPDGRYVLAAVRGDAFWTSRQIAIWSLKSGRHRGNLTGCPTGVTGIALLDDDRLVAGCSDGKIRIWDIGRALQEVDAFERSFLGAQVPR